jgi:hypothetical protein
MGFCVLCKRERKVEASLSERNIGFNDVSCPDCGDYVISTKATEKLIDIFNLLGTGTYSTTSELKQNLEKLRDDIREKRIEPTITEETLDKYEIDYTNID